MAQPRRWLATSAVLLLALALAPCVLCDPLEGLDDHQDTPPVAAQVEEAQDAGPAAAPGAASAYSGTAAFSKFSKLPPMTLVDFRNNINAFYVEIWAAGVLVAYMLCLVVGFVINKGIAEAWVSEFAKLLASNFTYTGPGGGMGLMRNSASNFTLYASGRRNCLGMLAELSLVPRQDLVSLLWCMVTPREDTLTIEVYMAEAAMPPLVLAVATPKATKSLQERSDVSKYTKRISTGKEMPAFSQAADKLCVLAEHSGIVADLLGDDKTQSLLSSSGANATAMKHFRSLHFTSDNTASKNKHVLTFTFKLPGGSSMAAIAPLMELVPHFIDAVATYKMPPDLRKRALDSRAKVAAAVAAEGAKDEKEKRQEALTQKRADAAEALRAKVSRMNPEARAKAEEKLAAKASKKEMRRGAVMKRGG